MLPLGVLPENPMVAGNRRASMRSIADFSTAIVAFSGGADSVLALHFAVMSKKPLIVWYLNHYLKEIEAKRLEVFQSTRKKFPEIKWLEDQADVSLIAKRLGYSWEHTASLMRRKRLLRLSATLEGAVVITGHNYSDYLETLALRKERKIPEHDYPALTACDAQTGFYRPLYQLTRDAVRNQVRALGLSYFDDPANQDTKFARNRVRKAVPSETPLPSHEVTKTHLVSPMHGGARELSMPLQAWNKFTQKQKAQTLFGAFRRLAIVRKFTRSHFSRAHLLPFRLPPFFAESEVIDGEASVIFRRGLGLTSALPRPENTRYRRGDSITRGFSIIQSYGRKALTKIFSERKMSLRQKRRTVIYFENDSAREAARIVFHDGSSIVGVQR